MNNATYTRYLVVGLVCGWAALPANATSFTYQSKNLLLGMRQAGGSSELVADLGPVLKFRQLVPGQTLPLSQVTTNQLNAVFDTLNTVSFSVLGTVASGAGDTNYADATLWVTRPRSVLSVQTAAWPRKSYFNQSSPSARIDSIGQKTVFYSANNPADPLKNSSTAVVFPAGDPLAYSSFMGNQGTLQGTFVGNVENTTPANFAGGNASVRSDLYELQPGAGAQLNSPGTYLGYFELSSQGTLTFTAAGGAPPLTAPRALITRSANQVTISFATVTGAHYLVGVTNLAGLFAPRASWPTLPAVITGDGAVQSVSDTITSSGRFYILSAGP